MFKTAPTQPKQFRTSTAAAEDRPVPQIRPESGDDRLRRERDTLALRYGFPGR